MQSFGRRSSSGTGAPAPRPLRDPSDKRFAPRRSSETPALLTFEDGHESFPCLIRDMSTTGARVELKGASGENPFCGRWSSVDRIRLVVRAHHIMYDCRIVRRGESGELGLKFAAAPKQITRVAR